MPWHAVQKKGGHFLRCPPRIYLPNPGSLTVNKTALRQLKPIPTLFYESSSGSVRSDFSQSVSLEKTIPHKVSEGSFFFAPPNFIKALPSLYFYLTPLRYDCQTRAAFSAKHDFLTVIASFSIELNRSNLYQFTGIATGFALAKTTSLHCHFTHPNFVSLVSVSWLFFGACFLAFGYSLKCYIFVTISPPFFMSLLLLVM